ncbi:calcium-binding protein, partial [Microcoleus sp. herbarium2]|uniref:calcium-binding protein n=1 Tax=Microcoleus sp. herbarium2 TaxID=3055433 RepID=UPI002FD02A7C
MTITPVSFDSAGNLGNTDSYNPSISADGRFVAFISSASNLVPGDTNSRSDIFVRDRLTNTTTRVSVDSAGNQGNNGSNLFNTPSISADGRFVAFDSFASNLVPGDTNGNTDIFVRDTLTNTTTRVSLDSAGNQANSGSDLASISADGRFVAFTSFASNLVPGDTNSNTDIFVRDTLTNTTSRAVDITRNPAFGSSFSYRLSISADGRFVAFSSSASNIVPGDTNNRDDIFVRDRLTNTTTPVSVDSAGNQGDRVSASPSMSADGRFVAFSSNSFNIVPNINIYDIFVRDTLTNTTTRVSVNSAGDPGNRDSRNPSISTDGRFVAFNSDASNLVLGDTNSKGDIFVRDRLTNTTTRVSLDSAGILGESGIPSISADGPFVAFDSISSNIVPGQTNTTRQIFVADNSSTPNVINGTPGNDNLTG